MEINILLIWLVLCLGTCNFSLSSLTNGKYFESLNCLRGGSSIAAQMAEIRARRAREYEQLRAKESSETDSVAGDWLCSSGVIGPATIGSIERRMVKGDARNYYLDKGVTVIYNRKTGTKLEAIDETNGWFQFSAQEGSKIWLITTPAGNVFESKRWYVPGFIEEVKNNPLRSSSLKNGQKLGNWMVSQNDKVIVLSNTNDEKFQVHLHGKGFSYLNSATEEVLDLDGISGKLERRAFKQEEWFMN